MFSKNALLATASALALVGISGQAMADEAEPVAVMAPLVVVGEDEAEGIETEVAVSAEELEASQPQNLKQIFEGNPGFAVSGGSTISQKFYVHGIDQNQLNVTIDGARQKNNMWHHDGSMQIDPSFLKAVDADLGVAPADAGPGAIGGAVRFETKDVADFLAPDRNVGGELTLGFDTNSEAWKTTGAGYARSGGFEIVGIGSWLDGKNYENGDGLTEAGTADDAQSMLGKLAYESEDGHRFELSSEYIQDDGRRRLRPNMGFVNPSMNDTDTSRSTNSLTYTTTSPTDLFDPEIQVYFNQIKINRPYETTWRGSFHSEMNSIGGKAQNTFRIAPGTITVGVDVYNDRGKVQGYNPAGVLALGLFGREEATNVGAYVQARLTPVERLMISTGIRADYQWFDTVDGKEYTNAGVSPNLSAEYEFIDNLSVFGGYSYVFGGIEMGDLALYHAQAYTFPADLDPTTSQNYRIGFKGSAGGFSGEIAYFVTQIENPVAWNYGLATRVEGEDLDTDGVDISARYDWTNAYLSAKYSHADTTYGNRIALPSDYDNGISVGDAFNFAGAYKLPEIGVTFGASAEIASDVDDQALTAAGFTNGIEGYEVYNAYTSWTPNFADNLTLRVEANNIFDEHYYSRGTYPQSGAVTPVYSPGRSFYFSANVKF